jgi:two-component system, LuxR family, response regulator FixJ
MRRREIQPDVATVFVIDPDPATGAMATDLLSGSELHCEVYSTCRDFLATHNASRPGCVVLEQRIPDMSGLQLQRRLRLNGSRQLPLVFVLGDPAVATAVELMRGGAIHVLEKPLRPVELLTAIQEALDFDRDRRHVSRNDEQVKDLIAALTRKEREVLELIAVGKSVKAMAAQLELSVRAIEQRRQGLMAKLRLGSALELMRFSVNAQRVFRPAAAKAAVAAATLSDNGQDLSEISLLDRGESPSSVFATRTGQDHQLNGLNGRAANGNGNGFANGVSQLVKRPR